MRKILSLGKYNMEGEVLGSGNFGRVELATHVLTNIKVAIKIIDTRKLNTTYASKNLYREARILAQIRHPNVVRMYETLKASYLYCLVLEYIPNKDLNSYLKTLQGSRMSERESWPMVRQLTSALVFLHQRNIVHRDLKMDNILLDENNDNIKIIDFGLSNMFAAGELLKTHCGSPEFAAPELFYDRHDYGPEVDAWSFGVIVYGMLVGNLPFVPGSMEPSKRHALLKMLNKGLTLKHKSQMTHLSVDCRSMLFQLIESNPDLRLGMSRVAESAWVTREGRYPIEYDIEPDVDKPLHAKVISKLAALHKHDCEYVEKQVSEYKYDGISSQYNMLMDRYSHLRRVQKITTPIPRPLKKPKPVTATQSRTPLLNNMKRPAPRMKAMKESPIKDDTFIGSPCADIFRSGTLREGKYTEWPVLTKPIIGVSPCVVKKDSLRIDGKQARPGCAGDDGSQDQDSPSDSKKLPQGETNAGLTEALCSGSPVGPVDSSNQWMTISSASTTLGHELTGADIQYIEDIMDQPSSSKWASTSAEILDTESMRRDSSRTLLVYKAKLSEQEPIRDAADTADGNEDATAKAAKEEDAAAKAANERPKLKSRLKTWIKRDDKSFDDTKL